MGRKDLCTFPFLPPWQLSSPREQLDSPVILVSLVMVSSTKIHTAFPAIFMSAPFFMAQAAPSLHPSQRQPSCGHGAYFLPASASSAAKASVFSSPNLPHSSPDCLAPQSWRGSSFCLWEQEASCAESLGERWGNRLNSSAFRSLALLRRLMSEDKPCSTAQMG